MAAAPTEKQRKDLSELAIYSFERSEKSLPGGLVDSGYCFFQAFQRVDKIIPLGGEKVVALLLFLVLLNGCQVHLANARHPISKPLYFRVQLFQVKQFFRIGWGVGGEIQMVMLLDLVDQILDLKI